MASETDPDPPGAVPVCPDCGSTRQARIFYGLPEFTDDLRARLEAGSIVLGGCCISGRDPEWRCRDCRREWGISRQSRLMYEAAAAGGAVSPPSFGVRLFSGILFALLFVPVRLLLLLWLRVVPTIRDASGRRRRLLRRGPD